MSTEHVRVIDEWQELDDAIDRRYGEHGRSFNRKRVVMPRAEYDALLARAQSGDHLKALIAEMMAEVRP